MAMEQEMSALAQRIARLEQADKDTRNDIIEIKADVKSILHTLAEMSGGKKALFALFSLLGAIIGTIGTYLGLHIAR